MTSNVAVRPSLLRRTVAGAGTVLVLTAGSFALAGPASAHVTVKSTDAAPGGYAKPTARVPNESATAGTVKVQVTLPADSPLASVSVKPHAGWDAQVTREKLPEPVQSGDLELTEAVRSITWTASPGVRVSPGQFEEFDISVGPLPEDVETLSFPAVQTYDDGEVVAWDEPAAEGGEEPEHPAPTLALAAASGDHHGAAAVSAASTEEEAAAPATSDSTDTTARALAAGGLAVGVAGLGAAGATTLAQRRRRVL